MSGTEQDGWTEDVHPRAIDNAVQNALWVAGVQAETEWDTRRFMVVFDAQLSRHWRELQKLWPKESGDGEQDERQETEQSRLVAATDGGIETSDNDGEGEVSDT